MVLFHTTDLPAPEIMALQKEVKSCSERVEMLQKEFKELKKDIESACKEMDATRSIINELVTKALFNDKK